MPPPNIRDSLSPDPLDLINTPLTPPRIAAVVDSSPAVRKPQWGRVARSPSETPSEEADRLSIAQSGLSRRSSSPSPEVGDSPAVRQPWGRATDGTGHSHLKQAYPAGAAAAADDPDNTLPDASQVEARPRTHGPEYQVADGPVFSFLQWRARNVPSMDREDSLPPPEPVSHANGIGAVVVPFRPEHEFPQPLREAEEKLASRIAAALTNPRDEGLNSDTFQTLIEAFLLPRLAGCNYKNQRFQLRQHSQLHAVSCTFKEPQIANPSSSARGKRKRYEEPPTDSDPLMRERLVAVKERRVPDMTSVAIFEDRTLIPNSRAYQITARKGPRICITEIKSFNWSDDPERVEAGLRAVLAQAHYQNYVAAQYLFREDKHLRHVASFTGAGFVWSYSEFHRWQYPLLYEQPLPMLEEDLKGWEESLAQKSPRKHKKARRYSSRQDASANEEDEDEDEEYQEGEEEEEEEEEGYPKFLEDFPNMPPENTPLDEIFRRYEAPQTPRGQRRKRISFLPILDIHGRTHEAFDVIVERMRRSYVRSKKNSDPDHQLVFDADPYEDGTCSATVARKQREREAAAQN